MPTKRAVFFDLETSGLDPQRHEIIQFAAAAVELPSFQIVEELELKIAFDPRRSDEDALLLNKYDEALWHRTAVPRADAFRQIHALIERHATVPRISRAGKEYKTCRMGGHNVASFDLPFLRAFYGARFCPCDYIPLDTLALASWWADLSGRQGSELTLSALALRLDVPLPPHAEHDALADLRATVGVAKRLCELLGLVP